MSERITEAELRRMDAESEMYLSFIPEPERADAARTNRLARLVAEVRRLRALIVEVDADPVREDQTGKPEGPLYEALLRHKAAGHAIAAEASAIREEQGR